MHPEIVQALMNERVREAHAAAVVRHDRRVLRPLRLSRNAGPRTTWSTRAA
jgi:hypothetical protein